MWLTFWYPRMCDSDTFACVARNFVVICCMRRLCLEEGERERERETCRDLIILSEREREREERGEARK